MLTLDHFPFNSPYYQYTRRRYKASLTTEIIFVKNAQLVLEYIAKGLPIRSYRFGVLGITYYVRFLTNHRRHDLLFRWAKHRQSRPGTELPTLAIAAEAPVSGRHTASPPVTVRSLHVATALSAIAHSGNVFIPPILLALGQTSRPLPDLIPERTLLRKSNIAVTTARGDVSFLPQTRAAVDKGGVGWTVHPKATFHLRSRPTARMQATQSIRLKVTET